MESYTLKRKMERNTSRFTLRSTFGWNRQVDAACEKGTVTPGNEKNEGLPEICKGKMLYHPGDTNFRVCLHFVESLYKVNINKIEIRSRA